jgi:hypothetical protein
MISRQRIDQLALSWIVSTDQNANGSWSAYAKNRASGNIAVCIPAKPTHDKALRDIPAVWNALDAMFPETGHVGSDQFPDATKMIPAPVEDWSGLPERWKGEVKARALVEEIRHYNAEAERDTVQYGGWQCDYTTEVVKCQKELDKLLALSPAPSVPEGMERELIEARERIAQLESQAAWRPISEFDPKDREELFLNWAEGLGMVISQGVLGHATHFRPLPAAPTTTDAEGGE